MPFHFFHLLVAFVLILPASAWAGCEPELGASSVRERPGGKAPIEANILKIKNRLNRDHGVNFLSSAEQDDFVTAMFEGNGHVWIKVPRSLRGQTLLTELESIENKLQKIDWLRRSGARFTVNHCNSRHHQIIITGVLDSATENVMVWLRHRLRRHNLHIALDSSVFQGPEADVSALSYRNMVLLRLEAVGEEPFARNMAHELVHAINYALCLKTGDCGKLISFVPAGEARFTFVGDYYDGGFRSDELEAWLMNWGITKRQSQMDRAMDFVRQLQWLRILAGALKQSPPYQRRNLKVVKVNDGELEVAIHLSPLDKNDPLVTVERRILQIENLLRARLGVTVDR